jgi:hypothetical protein
MKVSPREIHDWKKHPVTEVFFQYLEAQADYFKTDLINGAALNRDPRKTQGVPWTTGVIFGLSLALNPEIIEEEEESNE